VCGNNSFTTAESKEKKKENRGGGTGCIETVEAENMTAAQAQIEDPWNRKAS